MKNGGENVIQGGFANSGTGHRAFTDSRVYILHHIKECLNIMQSHLSMSQILTGSAPLKRMIMLSAQGNLSMDVSETWN